MKLLLFVLALALSFSVNAQSFFKPIPLPKPELRAGATALTQNNIRPLLDVTATVLGTNGTQLAGGAGIGVQHNYFDALSNTWVTRYSVSALAFLGTNGTKISGTVGLAVGIPGTNGLVQVGGGYDLTNMVWVILTGVGIKFN